MFWIGRPKIKCLTWDYKGPANSHQCVNPYRYPTVNDTIGSSYISAQLDCILTHQNDDPTKKKENCNKVIKTGSVKVLHFLCSKPKDE